MNKYILICLIVFTLCQQHFDQEEKKKEMNERRNKFMNCISTSEGVSDYLKNQIKEAESSHEFLFFKSNLNKKELDENDRKIIGECIKMLFKKRRNLSSFRKNKGLTPVIKSPRTPRKLGMLGGAFGSFQLAGVFDCIEYAQDAIKVVRDAINMIKSMDYTSAIISVYDNLSLIGDAISYCSNAIFPSDS